MAKRLPSRKVYEEKERVRGFNVPVSPLQAFDRGGIMLANRLPNWTKADHLAAVKKHEAAQLRKSNKWNRDFDKAIRKTFGRRPQVGDYKVSGIGRSEFDEPTKNRLRKLAHDVTFHSGAAYAHQQAATVAARRGGTVNQSDMSVAGNPRHRKRDKKTGQFVPSKKRRKKSTRRRRKNALGTSALGYMQEGLGNPTFFPMPKGGCPAGTKPVMIVPLPEEPGVTVQKPKRKNSTVRLAPAKPMSRTERVLGRRQNAEEDNPLNKTNRRWKGPYKGPRKTRKVSPQWWKITKYRKNGSVMGHHVGQGTVRQAKEEARKLSETRGVHKVVLRGPYKREPMKSKRK